MDDRCHFRLNADEKEGEISWPLPFLPLAKLCWQSLGDGNQANAVSRGEERKGMDLRRKDPAQISKQQVTRDTCYRKKESRSKGIDSYMVVAGCDFCTDYSEKITLVGDMHGRELSE